MSSNYEDITYFLIRTYQLLRHNYYFHHGQKYTSGTKRSTKVDQSKTRESIWPKKDQLRYYLFILTFAIDEPYCFLSWENWKPVNYFVKMSEFIGTKTPLQAKSFDQRRKKQYLQKHSNLTMLQWIITILKGNEFFQNPLVKEKLKELKKILQEEEIEFEEEIKQSKLKIDELKKQTQDDDIFIKK